LVISFLIISFFVTKKCKLKYQIEQRIIDDITSKELIKINFLNISIISRKKQLINIDSLQLKFSFINLDEKIKNIIITANSEHKFEIVAPMYPKRGIRKKFSTTLMNSPIYMEIAF
jgi:hypothetical protein